MEQMTGAAPDYPQRELEGGTISAHRVKFFVGLAVVVAAMGYFAFMAFQSATVYYYTVDELRERGPSEDGRMVRVSGKLIPDSFTREPNSTLASFALTDGSYTLKSVHNGVLPDLFFNEHSEIILEGTYTRQGVFESQNVIVKCPSKYVAAE